VTYDQTGDRLSKSGSGLAMGTYSYNPGTHQLIATGNAARTVDANGNTTAISEAGTTYGLGYNDRNRLAVAQLADSSVGSYTYNALGQRIQKVTSTDTERFDYDEASQLLTEAGTTNRDYVWLDDVPVAVVDAGGGTVTVSYVTADQLGTPRVVSDASGTTEWAWPYAGNAWGEQAPASNGYTFNLRFPGQYFDAESGLNYNQNRNYHAPTGRYTEGDPIGFLGGQSSIYAYADNTPVNNIDPNGLKVKVVARNPVIAQRLMNAYAYLNSHSQTARNIDMDLENSSTIYKIEPTNDMDNDEYCPSSDYLGCEGHDHTVFVDPCEFPLIPTTAGSQPITLPVLIGHELGHAWGYEDNVNSQDILGDNVRMVENPIRKELGLPLRTRY
jgi:RHS repeat-associated protein